MWAVLSVVINTYALLFLHIFIKTHITLSLYLKKKTIHLSSLLRCFFIPVYYNVMYVTLNSAFLISFFFLLRLSKKKTANRLHVSLAVSSSRMVL